MFARIALALPLATVVTAGLLFTMHIFVQTGHGQSDFESYRSVDFVRVERSEAPQVREPRPEKPEAQERPPAMSLPQAAGSFSSAFAVALAEPDIELDTEIGGIDMTTTDGEYLPIVKVAPVYPMRALQHRLEGYVIVEFVVTDSGAVRDVVVVESSSPVFERAAIEAARKFKYRPRLVDGTPIRVSGVRNRITFKLDV